MQKLIKKETGIYTFIHNNEKVFVRKFFIQGFNKNKSDVKSLFIGWGKDEFNTELRLKDFKKKFNLI